MSQDEFQGSCLCGSVKYKVGGELQRFYHCHCQRCRKATGTGHASNLLMKLANISWTLGEELVTCYKVPEAERFRNCFCSHCGSPVPRFIKELDMVVIPAGTLDSEPIIHPQARIFWESRAQWSCGGGDIPVFAEYDPGR